ncbi:hypothetical protein GCM10023340_42240 [Nocardioides marinquilinus]|uniref:Uncharacterized protein n=1 Tax=Nocardioides marinquilinus TaxID=1210400 RepID=A0ABP9Q2P9_9ACTN
MVAGVLSVVVGLGIAGLVVVVALRRSARQRGERAAAVAAAVAPRGLEPVAYDTAAVEPWRRRLTGSGGPLNRREVDSLGLMYLGTCAGRPCRLVDYAYNAGQGGTRRVSVLALGLAREVPTLDVRPQGVLSRLTDLVEVGRGETVDVEAGPLDEQHRVRSVDAGFAQALVTPTVGAALAPLAPVVLATVGSELLLVEGDELTPERAGRLLARAEALLGAVAPGVLD